MRITQLIIILITLIFLLPMDSVCTKFKKGTDYLSYAEDKLAKTKFDEYDITLLCIVEEERLTEIEIKEKIKQGMLRQNMDKNDPSYRKVYDEYYDLFKNRFSKRCTKARLKNTSGFMLVSESQCQTEDRKKQDFEEHYLTTRIYDKKQNKSYTIRHNGKAILEEKGCQTPSYAAMNQMFIPESNLNMVSLFYKKKPKNVKWSFEISKKNNQSDENNQLFEFVVNGEINTSYDVSISNPPQLNKVTSFLKNLKRYEFIYSEYENINRNGIDIARKYEMIRFDDDGNINSKETYNITDFEFDNIKPINNIESYLSSFKGYEYCILEGHNWKVVGKIDQNGVIQLTGTK